MTAIIKKLKKIYYFNYIAGAITLGFVALAIFVFPSGVIRIKESIIDLWYSLVYYVDKLFEAGWDIQPTVNEYSSVPWTPVFGLPATWEEFCVAWDEYWVIWATKENIMAYLAKVAEVMTNISRIGISVVIPLFLLCYLLLQRCLSTQNNDYNVDSRAVRGAKRFEDKVYRPVKAWILSFIDFLNENKKYKAVWLLIWLYNFNVIAIVIEFFAFYFYFAVAFDFLNIYKQIFKLLCDLSPMVAFIPVPVWCIIGYVVFCLVRRNIGYKVLAHHEAMNCGFIKERAIVTMNCGTMGSKKTTMIADMMLLQDKMFRDKALELLIENDLKFPEFPWCNFENFMRRAMYEHKVYSLATIRRTVAHLKWCFETYHTSEDAELKRSIRRHLKRRYGLTYDNYIFGYDFEKYGLYYDDKLKPVYIWDVISAYGQEYYVYVIKSSLIISNFSVRTDSIISDLGNLPMRDNDFYKRNSKLIYEISRYAKIIDYNAMRLGKKLGGYDEKQDSFEFGVGGTTEVGKERKNNLQLQDLKKKEETANQKNDGFNDWLKMIRHSATIDYVPFVRFFTDEQRPESWGADARDLCEIIHNVEPGDTSLALPFFALEELIYTFVYDKFVNLYLQYRYVRADNVLPIYLFKKLTAWLQAYYKGIYNTFGFCKLGVEVERGAQDGERKKSSYYLDYKRIYSDRFSTDCFSEFFTAKALRSPVGLDDLEEYKSSKATFDELKKQNSYFVADLMNKKENDK